MLQQLLDCQACVALLHSIRRLFCCLERDFRQASTQAEVHLRRLQGEWRHKGQCDGSCLERRWQALQLYNLVVPQLFSTCPALWMLTRWRQLIRLFGTSGAAQCHATLLPHMLAGSTAGRQSKDTGGPTSSADSCPVKNFHKNIIPAYVAFQVFAAVMEL